MARKEGNFLRGALGPFIFRVVRGKQLVSTRPARGTIKQTKATKTSSQTFGMASSLAAQIRKTFEINVGTNFDPTVNERLTGVIRKILGLCRDAVTKHYEFRKNSFIDLKGFDFNINSKMESQMALMPRVTVKDGQMKVVTEELAIPRQLNFPLDSFRCQLIVSMSLLRLRDGLVLGKSESQSLDVTRHTKTLAAHTFSFNVPTGCLCIATLSLRYSIAGKSGWKAITNTEFNPSCICGALITPGTYQQDERTRWEDMVRFD